MEGTTRFVDTTGLRKYLFCTTNLRMRQNKSKIRESRALISLKISYGLRVSRECCKNTRSRQTKIHTI